MLQAILSSFGLVALSEMGDKTQLLAFSLAARFRAPVQIMAGIFVATLLNHALASTAGAWAAAQVEPRMLQMALAATFLAFGFWTLKPDQLEEKRSDDDKYGPFVTTAFLFFLAEMGDKTQFATAALAAQFQSAAVVTLGTTLGMMLSDGLAVLLGDRLAAHVQMRWVRFAAASLFFAFGIVALIAALRG
jgi:putative Ca2+/H+ antiporter (TMEM165/GDT1 family)